MVKLVIDASAGFELILETATGRALLNELPRGAEWWVPEHYFVEVASTFRRAELRGEIGVPQAAAAMSDLLAGRFHRAQVRPLLRRAWERRGHLTIADGLYVVLAEELGATLVTADLKLARSPGLTIPTLTP